MRYDVFDFDYYRRRMLKEFRDTIESVERFVREIEELFEEMRESGEELEKVFEESLEEEMRGEVSPVATLIERRDHYLLVVDVPGAREETITVEVYRDRIVVQAELDREKIARAFGARAFHRTRRLMRGEYRLPVEADLSRIETRRQAGRVYIKIPKLS
ncbi:MAG: Hsp20/alpha crystallin family protein [Acidilobaceae archaeon]